MGRRRITIGERGGGNRRLVALGTKKVHCYHSSREERKSRKNTTRSPVLHYWKSARDVLVIRHVIKRVRPGKPSTTKLNEKIKKLLGVGLYKSLKGGGGMPFLESR